MEYFTATMTSHMIGGGGGGKGQKIFRAQLNYLSCGLQGS